MMRSPWLCGVVPTKPRRDRDSAGVLLRIIPDRGERWPAGAGATLGTVREQPNPVNGRALRGFSSEAVAPILAE